MSMDANSEASVLDELAEMRWRLAEAEATISALRRGCGDSAQAHHLARAQLSALDGEDAVYRTMVDQMRQGAAILAADGAVVYCNGRLAEMLRTGQEQCRGGPFQRWVAPASRAAFQALLGQAESGPCQAELNLVAADDAEIAVCLDASRLPIGGLFSLAMIVTDLAEQKRQTAEADERAEQLRRMAYELTHAEQRERRRLSQILHDHLQQLLVAARLKVGLLRRCAESPEAVRRGLEQINELLEDSISESRSLAADLSPPILQGAGLSAVVEWVARRMEEQYGLAVGISADPRAELDGEELRLLVFQAVRELLFNVVKHSGVFEARVNIRPCGERSVEIVVSDTGAGFDLERHGGRRGPPSGLGLFQLGERLQILGGRMEIATARGAGTQVTLLVPRGLPDTLAASRSVGYK